MFKNTLPKIIFLLVIIALPFTMKAQYNSIEVQKAQLIYKIIEQLQWPNDNEMNYILIGTVNSSPELLKQLKKKKPSYIGTGIKVEIHNFNSVDEIQAINVKGVNVFPHIIYLEKNTETEIKQVLSKINNKTTLLITDNWGNNKDIMVDLFIDKNVKRVGFAFSFKNIENQGISVPDRFIGLGGKNLNAQTLLDKTEKELKAKENQLQAKEDEIQAKEDEIREKQVEIIDKKKQIIKKNNELLIKEKEVQIIESNLTKKESEIEVKEKKLKNLQVRANQHQQQLDEKVAVINNKEKEINEQKHNIDIYKNKILNQVKEFEDQAKLLEEQTQLVEEQKEIVEKYTEEIDSKKAELRKLNFTIQMQRYAIGVFILLLIVIVILLFFIFKNLKQKKRQNTLLEEKNTEIQSQSEELEDINVELEKLSIVASETSNAVAILDFKGEFEWINSGYTKLYGYTLQLLKSELGNSIVSSSSHTEIETIFNKCLIKKQPISYETKAIHRTGKNLWVQTSLSPILNDADEVQKFVIIDSDITKIKEAEVKIQEQNVELQATLTNLKDTQNQLVQSEKMASLGKLIANIAHELNTPLGAIKSSIYSLDAASQKTMELLPKLIRALPENKFEIFNDLITEAKNNKEYYTSRETRKIKRNIKKQLSERKVNNYDYIADILVDINIYKDAEKYIPLYEETHQKLIMESAYNIVMLNNTQRNMQTAIDRASKTILALKSYSHSTIDDKQIKTDIPQTIDNVLTIYHNQLKHGIEVIKEYEEIPKIICSPDKINQVWTNIIQNAIQAMNLKGTLKIKIKAEQEYAKISFTDSGPGIPDEYKDKIFDPFFTTKPTGEGTGLGLDIINKIIEKHNGKITFVTKIGFGTTFFVFLPI